MIAAKENGLVRMVNGIGATLASCFSTFGSPFISTSSSALCPSAPRTIPTPPPSDLASPRGASKKLPPAVLKQICHQVRTALGKLVLPKLCAECRGKVGPVLRKPDSKITLGALCEPCREVFIKQAASVQQRSTSTSRPSSPIKTNSHPKKVVLKVTQTPRLDETLPLFEALNAAGVPWCRYCGTTESLSWRPGPWGPNTLCRRHGCGFVGFDTTAGHDRLDLSPFAHETRRTQPILKNICRTCWERIDTTDDASRSCKGCSLAYHEGCAPKRPDELDNWYCDSQCRHSLPRVSVRIKIPHGTKLPYERQPVEKMDSPTILVPSPRHPIPSISSNTKTRPSLKRRLREDAFEAPTTKDIKVIAVPFWRKSLPTMLDHVTCNEDITPNALISRHTRYEEAEKSTRLLRPEVLKSLTGCVHPSRDGVFERKNRSKSCF